MGPYLSVLQNEARIDVLQNWQSVFLGLNFHKKHISRNQFSIVVCTLQLHFAAALLQIALRTPAYLEAVLPWLLERFVKKYTYKLKNVYLKVVFREL